MRKFILILIPLFISGCNSIYLKPESMDKNALFYSPRAGFSMARSVKETMENRGYNVRVGKLVRVSEISGAETYNIPKGAKYAVNVKERHEILRPIWCMFNGFWWWNFNVSIIDRTNNNEILSWRGRGCQNSSLNKLNEVLDKLEMKRPEKKPVKRRKKEPELLVLAPKTKAVQK